ncbi:MAG TPA: phospho-N-acetylmuramoyl-pentapeptide-transferase [Candidatus Saccharimonadales bacterium]|nr:phospho-N-acetylmuramoyl-pentapeptide-transferase [Candidatus Saccharimonadales bacterium]
MTFTFVHEAQVVSLTRILTLGFAGFAISMLLTPVYTRLAYRNKWWKRTNTEAITGEQAPIYQKLHAAKHKRNIPTMGGLVIIVTVAVVTLLLNLTRSQTYLPLFVLVGAGLVGLLDDYFNITGNGGIAGLRWKVKFGLIFTVALLGALYFYFKLGYHLIHIPAVGNFSIGWGYIPLIVLVVVSTANAVNITDGLDGLSGGLLSTAFGAYAIIAYFQHSYGIAGFCATIVGVMLTYTWFNIYPARFFMGDSGAFALGTTLGVIAVLTNAIVVLPIIGGVFVIEAGSSLLQITSKKLFKRKIFLSAPIHHHLEAIGWPETKVTMRLWVVGQALGVIGLTLGLLGNHVL